MPILKRELSVVFSGSKQEHCGDGKSGCQYYAADRCDLFDALLHRDNKKHFRCRLCHKHFSEKP